MLTILDKLFKALNSEQSAGQLAMAVSLSVVIGFTPFLSLHNAILILIALWFRVNLTLLIVSYPLFALVGFLLSPMFEKFGLSLLQMPSLIVFWEAFFNTLVGRWSNFYYSGVMGSFVIGLVVAVISYPIVRFSVVSYRENWMNKIEQFKVTKLLKASKLWNIYSQQG